MLLDTILSLILYVQTLQQYEFQSTKTVVVTAYNSCEWQCDGDPFVTSTGYRLKEGDRVAATYLAPPGSFVSVNGILYRVEDVTSKKYANRIDLWFGDCTEENIQRAKEWGDPTKTVKIYTKE